MNVERPLYLHTKSYETLSTPTPTVTYSSFLNEVWRFQFDQPFLFTASFNVISQYTFYIHENKLQPLVCREVKKKSFNESNLNSSSPSSSVDELLVKPNEALSTVLWWEGVTATVIVDWAGRRGGDEELRLPRECRVQASWPCDATMSATMLNSSTSHCWPHVAITIRSRSSVRIPT